jgi:hypothetical protein
MSRFLYQKPHLKKYTSRRKEAFCRPPMHFPSRRLAEESRKGITKNNIFAETTTKRLLYFQLIVLHGSATHPLDPQQGIGG